MATLIVVKGPATGSKFALEQHRLVMVGRDPKSTFQLVDTRMSRSHLQIRYDAEKKCHFAIDFDSRNGVFVNETKIEAETLLKHGDEIRLGDSTVIYSTDDSPDAIRVFEVSHRIRAGYDKTTSDVDEEE